MKNLLFIVLWNLVASSSFAVSALQEDIFQEKVCSFLGYKDVVRCSQVNKELYDRLPIFRESLRQILCDVHQDWDEEELQQFICDFSKDKPFDKKNEEELLYVLRSQSLSKALEDIEKRDFHLLWSDSKVWLLHGYRLFLMMHLESIALRKWQSDEQWEDVYRTLSSLTASITDRHEWGEVIDLEQESRLWPHSDSFFHQLDRIGDYDSGLIQAVLTIQKQALSPFSIAKHISLRVMQECGLRDAAEEQLQVCLAFLGAHFFCLTYLYALDAPVHMTTHVLSYEVPSMILGLLFIPMLPIWAAQVEENGLLRVGATTDFYQAMYRATSPSDRYFDLEFEDYTSYPMLRPSPRFSLVLHDEVADMSIWQNTYDQLRQNPPEQMAKFLRPWLPHLERFQEKWLECQAVPQQLDRQDRMEQSLAMEEMFSTL